MAFYEANLLIYRDIVRVPPQYTPPEPPEPPEDENTCFIFYGTNNNFTSIWCDPDASLTSGRFYVGREDDLTIINNNNSQASIEYFCSTTVSGETGDLLKSDDSVDINVIY